MKDRFTLGLISGIVAGGSSSLTNLILISGLHFGSLRFIDFSGAFIYGRKPSTPAEDLFAWVGYFAFTSFLGIIFAYLIPQLTSQNIMLKSITFGIGVWFVSYAITFLFQTPFLNKVSLPSVLSNFISSTIFGIVLGWVYQRLWKRKQVDS